MNSASSLTTDDIKILEPFVVEFKKYETYELSILRELLNQIEAADNERIKSWKDEMFKAIRSGNEEKYKELLDLQQ